MPDRLKSSKQRRKIKKRPKSSPPAPVTNNRTKRSTDDRPPDPFIPIRLEAPESVKRNVSFYEYDFVQEWQQHPGNWSDIDDASDDKPDDDSTADSDDVIVDGDDVTTTNNIFSASASVSSDLHRGLKDHGDNEEDCDDRGEDNDVDRDNGENNDGERDEEVDRDNEEDNDADRGEDNEIDRDDNDKGDGNEESNDGNIDIDHDDDEESRELDNEDQKSDSVENELNWKTVEYEADSLYKQEDDLDENAEEDIAQVPDVETQERNQIDDLIQNDVIDFISMDHRLSDENVFEEEILIEKNEKSEFASRRNSSQLSTESKLPETPILQKRPMSARCQSSRVMASILETGQFYQKLHAYDNRENYRNWERTRPKTSNGDRQRKVAIVDRKQRPKSSIPSSGRPSQKELRKVLPRQSFFDCHDVTLKEAGYDLSEYTKGRKSSKAYEFTTPAAVIPGSHFERRPSLYSSHLTGRASQLLKKSPTVKRSDRGSIDLQPMLNYLNTVKDIKPVRNDPCNDRLVKLGALYDRRNFGEEIRENKVTQAANCLWARTYDPSKFHQTKRPSSRRSSSATTVEDGRSEQRPSDGGCERQRVQQWLSNMPTQRILKARERAIRELTGDDIMDLEYQMKMNRQCRYLRQIGVPIV